MPVTFYFCTFYVTFWQLLWLFALFCDFWLLVDFPYKKCQWLFWVICTSHKDSHAPTRIHNHKHRGWESITPTSLLYEIKIRSKVSTSLQKWDKQRERVAPLSTMSRVVVERKYRCHNPNVGMNAMMIPTPRGIQMIRKPDNEIKKNGDRCLLGGNPASG